DKYKELYKELAKSFKDFLGGGSGGGNNNPLTKNIKTISDIIADMQKEMQQLSARAKVFGKSISQVKIEKIGILKEYMKTLANSLLPKSIEKAKELGNEISKIRSSLNFEGVSPIEGKLPFAQTPIDQNKINEATSKVRGTARINKLEKATKDWGNTLSIVNGLFTDIFQNAAGGQSVFEALARAAERMAVKLAAAAASAALISAISGGATSFIEGLGKVLGFANGGFVSSPTLAVVGDDNTGGEWILNQNQMSNLIENLGNRGGGEVHITGEFVQRGNDLVAVVDTTKQMNSIL